MHFRHLALSVATLILLQLHHTTNALRPTAIDRSSQTVAAIVEGTFQQRNQLLAKCTADITAATNRLLRSINAAVRQQLGRVPDAIIDRQIVHLARQYITVNWLSISGTNRDIEANVDDSEQRIERRLAPSPRLAEAQRAQKGMHTIFWQWKSRVEQLIIDRNGVGERIVDELVRNVLAAFRSGGAAAVNAQLDRGLQRLQRLIDTTAYEVFQLLSISDVRTRELGQILIAIDRQLYRL